jgi:Tfp pilus assembly protein PilF
LKVKPEDAGVHSNLALALKAIGNAAAATEHFSEAIRLQPNNIGIQINFADFLTSEGKTAESITHYVQAVRLAPEFMETNYRLAAAYFRAGHVTEATETLEKALLIAQQTGQTDEVPQLMALLNEYREYRSGSKSGK